MMIGYILACMTVLCLTSGNLLFDSAAKNHPSLFKPRNIILLATEPVFMSGLVLYGVGTILWVAALQRVPLAYLYPFLAGNYVLVPIASLIIKRELPSPRLTVGIMILCLGLGFIIAAR